MPWIKIHYEFKIHNSPLYKDSGPGILLPSIGWEEDSIDRDSLYFYTLVRQGDPLSQRSISKRLPYIEIDSPSNRLNLFFLNPAATYVAHVGKILYKKNSINRGCNLIGKVPDF